jgi:hypothetical protein
MSQSTEEHWLRLTTMGPRPTASVAMSSRPKAHMCIRKVEGAGVEYAGDFLGG